MIAPSSVGGLSGQRWLGTALQAWWRENQTRNNLGGLENQFAECPRVLVSPTTLPQLPTKGGLLVDLKT